MGKHGLTCDNVISFDLVTADGDLITADAHNNPYLYWALRGGGGNFGIVTSFQFQLHDVGPLIIGGMMIHPMDKAKDLMRLYRDITADPPDELEVYMALMTSPDGGPVAAMMVGYNGDLTEGEAAIKSIRNFGSRWPTSCNQCLTAHASTCSMTWARTARGDTGSRVFFPNFPMT